MLSILLLELAFACSAELMILRAKHPVCTESTSACTPDNNSSLSLAVIEPLTCQKSHCCLLSQPWVTHRQSPGARKGRCHPRPSPTPPRQAVGRALGWDFASVYLILIATHWCKTWQYVTQPHRGISHVKCSKQPQNSPFSKLDSKYLQIREELEEVRNSWWMNHKH